MDSGSTSYKAQRQRLNAKPSANDLVNSHHFASPLAQLSLGAASTSSSWSTGGESTSSASSSAPPPLNLNLFRSPSVYSVDSIASLSTISADEHAFNAHVHPRRSSPTSEDDDREDESNDAGRPESPSTPRATRFPQSDYFANPSNDDTHGSPSRRTIIRNGSVPELRGDDRQLTPERSFVVQSRLNPQTTSTGASGSRPKFHLGDIPPRQPPSHFNVLHDSNRTNQPHASPRRVTDLSSEEPLPISKESAQPITFPSPRRISVDMESIVGEQGSEWGEDEQNFEWIDTEGVRTAENGDGKSTSHLINISPSKMRSLSRIKSVVGGHGGEGGATGERRKLRKNLVFPRRAAPPPPPESASSCDQGHSSALPSASSLSSPQNPPASFQLQQCQQGIQANVDRSNLSSGIGRPPPLFTQQPMMVPMKSEDALGPSSLPMRTSSGQNRQSYMSTQSAAYSFYDLDSPGPSTPRAGTPRAGTPTQSQSRFSSSRPDLESHRSQSTSAVQRPSVAEYPPAGANGHTGHNGSDGTVPRGTYTKVSVSKLERREQEDREIRERSSSDPNGYPARPGMYNPDERVSTMSAIEDWTPEMFISKGIEARGKGDLPKSAWFFMKAAQGGSSTGRMYYGLALRHGWGIARDDKKAFAELRQACDESLAEGGLNFHQSPGANKLTLQQKKILTRDLSLGMFEIANCFLEGVGTKKAPEVAISYLRNAGNLGDLAAQEQLGFLLSKGGSGVKKDMKEAAKWYRMAIGQGSTNTFGLAWVWKVSASQEE